MPDDGDGESREHMSMFKALRNGNFAGSGAPD